MKRREFLHSAALVAASLPTRAQTVDQAYQYGYVGKSRIYFELHGDPRGKPFFLGYPFMA